jgi:hypothetical protein
MQKERILMKECCNHEWLYNQEKMISSEYRIMCKEFQELIEQKNKEIKEKDFQISFLMNQIY